MDVGKDLMSFPLLYLRMMKHCCNSNVALFSLKITA